LWYEVSITFTKRKEFFLFMEVISTRTLFAKSEETQMLAEFYSKKFYFSYSSLNKLLWNPTAWFQHYVMRKREDKLDKHLLGGKVVHALLLSQDFFNKLFVMVPNKLPGDNTMKVVHKVFKQYQEDLKTNTQSEMLSDYRSLILQILVEKNLHQSLTDDKPAKNSSEPVKSGDDKRIEKILTQDAVEYFEHLIKKGSKDVIDNALRLECERAVSKVKSNLKIMDLLGFHSDEFRNIEVFNEYELQAELVNYPFGIKGIIDNLKIDHDYKIIYINDVKTTGKELAAFRETIEFWNYWMQAIIYIMLVAKNFQHLISDGYQIQFRFIVIDVNGQVYSFPVSSETMSKWKKRFINEGLFKAHYHYTNKKFELPFEFSEELVIL
jgi:hypothetical protein